MSDFCDESGIHLHVTAAYSPEENGVSERGNRTVAQKARAMMIQSGVPQLFWFEACRTAVFLINRTITAALSDNRTPFEAWNFRKPSVEHLRVFGCQSFMLIRKESRTSKYSPVSSEGILMGFMEDNFDYRIYDLTSKTIRISHHVTFNESVFPCVNQNPTPWLPDDFLLPCLTSKDNPVTSVNPPRLELIDDDDLSLEEMAKGEKTKAVVTEVSHRDVSTDDSEVSQQPMPCKPPTQVSCQTPQSDTQSPALLEPTPARTSARLKGAIPSYKGMGAVWQDTNLNN